MQQRKSDKPKLDKLDLTRFIPVKVSQPKKSRKSRGAVSKENGDFLGFWCEKESVDQIDKLVRLLDTDRSKLLRQAVREKMARHRELLHEPSSS